jgi:hypothetical protein
MAAWTSENDDPITGLLGDVVHTLDRLECRSAGQDKGTGRHAFSVRHAHLVALSPGLVTTSPPNYPDMLNVTSTFSKHSI